MKKILLFLSIIGLGSLSIHAQCILRYTPSSGDGQVYTSLDQAYSDAQDDDIIYLSGHTFQFGLNAVEKRLQWIGAGVHSDSTLATGLTRINPVNASTVSFVVRPNAGGSSFTGINFGGFRLTDCDTEGIVNLVTFSRCKFQTDWISLSFSQNWAGSQLHYRFQECIFNTNVNGNGFASNASSIITFDNCLFARGIFRLRTGTYNFNNCVLWPAALGDRISQSEGCTFTNCIFWDAEDPNFMDAGYLASGNTFDHCAFSHAAVPVYGNGANPTIVSACIANVSSLFVETNGNTTYEDSDNYHLVSGSEALTAGNNGGECGIYGGNEPAKEGWVPYNPHISSQVIAPATINGLLNIQIITGAQSH